MAQYDYPEIAALYDDEKVLVVPVTARQLPDGSKRFSCAFQREYVTGDGTIRRTYWLQLSHLRRLRKLLDAAIERMATEEEKSKLECARAAR